MQDDIPDLTEQQRRRRQMPPGGEIAYFKANQDDVTIRYALWPATVSDPRGTIILLPGRTEFIEKFFEVVNELRERGFAVASMDWRGQGLSTRPLSNREKHYFKDFSTALPDLAQFINSYVAPNMPRPFNIVAHSMGGHLSLRFLHDYPGVIEKAVFTAPMCGINFEALPKWVARSFASVMCKLGFEENYLPGFGDYKDGRWGWRAKLTSDMDRFEDEDYFIRHNRDLALGGTTFGWLRAALASVAVLHSPGYPEAINVPILVVQAGGDQIVDNAKMTALVNRLPNAQLLKVPGSMHEILKEQDQYREQFWAAFDDFMDIKRS